MSHVTDMETAAAAALAPMGIRAAADPAAAVPPCLLIDDAPEYLRPGNCGIVWSWTSYLIPATTTGHLAALWLADQLPAVLDAIPGEVTEAKPLNYRISADDPGVLAYEITHLSQ